MPIRILTAIVATSWLALAGCSEQSGTASGQATFDSYDRYDGFVDLFWDAEQGRLLLRIENLATPFLYQSSLPRGVGSNDLGLDRGQLGATRLVSFQRSGPKLLLVQHNLAYRARSDDAREREAVTESFAESIIWGFQIIGSDNGAVVADATDFFLRDADGIAARLAEAEEGSYSVDAARSAIYLPRTKTFPDNTEVEAIVTFAGQATGKFLPSVAPDASAITVHLHHSFIRLPDDDYQTIAYDPRAGIIGTQEGDSGFADYASAIGTPLRTDFARRHRLKKREPGAVVSDAVQPIVYYLDPGVPEPVRSALLDGARWWQQAFEAAGYRNAFEVQMLPDDADPMDVRYNVIQWVHRATRGWSYGSSVVDPRSGEIIKGHVTLGSLRVRQDYLLIEGLLSPYGDDTVPDTMQAVALARIRQLAAHEVGHTLGLEHNFAASTQDRASVMDYPFPVVNFTANGSLDFSSAYGEGIGDWDKRAVLYAYQDFPPGVDAAAARREILEETMRLGFKYVADGDSRSLSAAHPDGNLWDNGSDAIAELQHLLRLREHALNALSANAIRNGQAMASIEEVLVPVYLLHRYQLEAVGKLVGGAYYTYALRGDGQQPVTPVTAEHQRAAITALLGTLDPALLRLPPSLLNVIPPRPPGLPRTREDFAGNTGAVFDELAPAASAIALTLDVLLDPVRAARMSRSAAPQFAEVTSKLLALAWFEQSADPAVQALTGDLLLTRLLRLCAEPGTDAAVRATALAAVNQLDSWLASRSPQAAAAHPNYAVARLQIERMRRDPTSMSAEPRVAVPPGSPIGALTE